MENVTETQQPKTAVPINSVISPIDARLCSLLEDDYFLELVLKQLLPQDVAEGRLVCRQWREVIKRLPVEVCRSKGGRVSDVIKYFPGASSATIEIRDDEEPEEVLRQLISARNLRHLAITSWKPWKKTETIARHFGSMKQLRDLSLEWHNEEQCSGVFEIFSSLKSLTNLRLGTVIRQLESLEPLEEMRCLADLSLELLVLEMPDNQAKLPFMKHVTRLSIGTCYVAGIESGINTLQMISSYAPTLRSLRLGEISTAGPYHDLSLLSSFSRLETFSLHCSYSDQELLDATNLLSAIPKLEILRSLELCTGPCMTSAVLDSVSALTKLQHLSYQPWIMGISNDPAPSVSAMAHLSSLSLRFAPVGMSLVGLTGLVELDIQNSAENIVDLCTALEKMLQLEKLALSFHDERETVIPRGILDKLERLKSVHLCGARIDEGQ